MTGPDTTAPPPRQHPSGGRHLLRALIVVASAVALIVLASLGLLTYLRTPAGTARLLRFGVEAANGAIAGRIDAESATLQGSHLVLHRVTLTDPEGERVAFVEEVQAELVLRALLYGNIEARSLRLIRPSLWVVLDDEGSNLQRTFAARHPGPEDAAGRPPPLTFVVGRFDIEEGRVEVQSPEEASLLLEGLALGGGGRYALRSRDFQLQARGNGALDRPTPGPVTLVLQAEHRGSRLVADVDLRASGASLVADLRQAGPQALDGHLALDLPPALGRALVPGWPVRVPLTITGEAQRTATGFLVTAHAAAGRSRLEVQGDVDPAQATARTLRVEGRHLQLAELLGRGPDTDLGFVLTGSGSGTSWTSAAGKLELSFPASRVRDAEVGPVAIAARIHAGRLEVTSLHARLPGVDLSGTGHSTSRALEASLALEVTDLAALSRTLGDLVGPLPPLGGQGSLHVQLGGRPTHPSVEAEGRFASLAVGPVQAQGLALELRLPDVARPLDATGNVQMEGLVVAGRALGEIRGALTSSGRGVDLQLSAGSPVLRVHLAGTADPDAHGLLLEMLVLDFPDASWGLKAPVALRFDAVELETEKLELVSGPQSIAVTGRTDGRRLQGSLRVARLDLARLPAVLVPASVGLAGTLDLSLDLSGPERHPDVGLTGNLVGGSLRGLTGLAAHVDARRAGSQLTLTGTASGLGSTVALTLKAPETALTQRIHQPVSVQARADGVDLGRVLCELARAGILTDGCPGTVPVVTGKVDLDLDIDGFADEPRLHLLSRGADVRARQLPAADWTLSVDGDDRTKVAVKLQARVLGGTLEAQATVEGTTGQLLTRRRSWVGWRTVPVQATVRASGLALAPLRVAGLVTRDLAGTAQLEADVTGTLAAPHGRADLRVSKLVLDPWPESDLHLEIAAEETTDARLTLTVSAGQSGSLHVAVGSAISRLWTTSQPEELAQVPLLVEGQLGPFELRDLPLDTNRLRRERRLLDGKLKLTFEGHGTLLAPTGSAELTAIGLGPADGAHFEGTARLRSAEGKHVFEVALHSTSGGTLDLDGEVQLDLSLPALRRGLRLGDAPLTAHLRSVRFEPDFVASLIPWMRSLTGTLEVEGQAGGTLGRPQLNGSLSLTDGAMGIIGFGLYQNIQLKASASNERFAIEELSARVQGGTLALQLAGRRSPEGFALKGALRTEDLPVVLDDQLWCVATLETELVGVARPWMLDFTKVTVSKAELQLPPSGRKNIQNLGSPADVILTRHGTPVDKRQALRALAFDPRRRGRTGAAQEPMAETILLRLSLEAPNRITVRSQDVNLELGLSKPFKVELGDETEIFGEVRILRGRGDVWGRRFEVQPGGRVHFDGLASRPQINVTGVYASVQTQAKVYMRFTGVGGDVQITPSSDPPMSESEIYTLLATGRTTLKQSSLASSSALAVNDAGASIIGSWAATELKKAVGGALPIDVLSVEVAEDRGVSQTRLEAGKYLTDDIYIGYQARIGADPFRYQNTNALRVEYQFLRRWSLQLEYGDANAGSLDAVWSRDY